MTLQPKIGDIIEIEQGDSCFEVRVMGITKDGYLCEQDNIQGAILLEGTGLDEADATDIEDFLRSGGRVERVPFKNTRKEKGAAFRFGSKHIGAVGGSGKGMAEMDNRTAAGDRREQRAYSPEKLKQREKELQADLKKVSPEMRKKLRLPEPKEGVAEGQADIEESGLQYYTGVKKHGAKYMKLAAKAGREGASQEELGRLRDRYSKAEKTDEGRFGRDRDPFYGGDDFRNRERNVGVENERNNYQVVVNGKLWKVFADRQQAMNIARSLKMKGKDVEVFPTGAPPSQSMSEMEGHQKTFKVVYYSPKTDRNVSKIIRAKNESDIWDQFKVKGIDVVSVKEQGVAEAGIDPTLGPRGRDRDMRRIDPGPEEKYYFQVPFELKTLAKDMGLRWDADKKKWFTTSILTKTQAEKKFKPWKGVAEGSEQYYAIVHKVNNKSLSTHRDLESAKDEWRGLDQNQRQFYKVVTTKKAPKDWSMKEQGMAEDADLDQGFAQPNTLKEYSFAEKQTYMNFLAAKAKKYGVQSLKPEERAELMAYLQAQKMTKEQQGVAEDDLDEDWRKKLAAAGMAGMMGLSGAAGAADRVPDTAKEPIIATVVIDGEARRLDLTPKGFDDVKEAERFLKKFLADRGIKDWQAKIERSKPGTGKYERLSISGMGGLESIQSRQGVAEGSLNELSTGTLKSYREKSNREVNAFKEKEKSDQLSDKDFFKKQDRLMGITGASKRIDKRGITGVGEDSLNELFEPQTEYYELSNGDIIQASYRPMPNQTAMPGTVKIKHVDPALMPKGSSFDSTGSIQRWDKAPDGVKQEIEKFVGQANKVSHVTEAEYQGRKVPLGKKMAGDVKKSKVYVRKPNGKVVKVNFGDKNMTIKKSNPARRKSFRARHNCANPGPRWKARYWSCRSW